MSLPAQIDPRKLASQGITLEGVVSAKDLPRLSASVENITDPLNVFIQFALDETRQHIVTGKASIKVDVICQRCLDRVNIEIKTTFGLQVIWSEDQLAKVAPNYEPWVVVDKIADLNIVLEDEVLLVLPIVNYHNVGECTGTAFDEKVEPVREEAVVDSPFSVLKQLKN